MPLPPNPRGSSVPTPQTPPQIQPAHADPTPVPNCTGNTSDPARASLPNSNPQSEIPIPQSPLPNPTSHIPHPPSQTPLSESAARELAKLKSQLHALASPDGFAPTRDEFTRALRNASRPYCKFFKGYDQFIRACGLKSANDRRREITADRRAARWEAQSAVAQEASNSSVPSVPSVPSDPSVPFIPSAQPGDTPPANSETALYTPPPLDGQMPSSFHSAFRNPKSAIRNAKPRTNEMFYGDPIHNCDMAHAPVNEQGVVLLFGMLAKKLGYRIEMVRTGYPDCEAKHKGLDKKWRRLRIEFEFVTSRFNHDPTGCDLIVCWEDDANPTHLPVLALKDHVGKDEPAEPADAEPSAAKAARAQPNRAAPRNFPRLNQPTRSSPGRNDHNRKKPGRKEQTRPNRPKPNCQKQSRQKPTRKARTRNPASSKPAAGKKAA